MKLSHKIFGAWLGLAWLCLVWQPVALAQALQPKPVISFNSFTSTYHLSRDANGRSLLTSEEVILADFPSNGNFSGITRSIPKTYQGRSVQVKVLNVSDAAGTPIPYKTASDNNNNLVVTTGDPSITLYGSQTFRISYQTRDVININAANNQFLLDVNGRGWDQSFNQVTATLYIPKSFEASLASKPSCYIGYLNQTFNSCSIDTQTSANLVRIDSKAQSALTAHQALVLNLNFKTATFTHSKDSKKGLLLGAIGGLVILALAGFGYRRLS